MLRRDVGNSAPPLKARYIPPAEWPTTAAKRKHGEGNNNAGFRSPIRF